MYNSIPFPTEPLKNAAWADVAAEKIVSGSPKSAYQVIYGSEDGAFSAGIYECTAGAWRVSYSEDEFCTLIEGRVRLTPDGGAPREYAAPDSFVIPSGFNGVWEPLTPLRKFFVIYEKAA